MDSKFDEAKKRFTTLAAAFLCLLNIQFFKQVVAIEAKNINSGWINNVCIHLCVKTLGSTIHQKRRRCFMKIFKNLTFPEKSAFKKRFPKKSQFCQIEQVSEKVAQCRKT